MKYAILDVETTIFAKGNPFSECNRLCLVGIRILSTNHIFDIEYGGLPYGDKLQSIQELLDSCDVVVGFNLKFDLNWLARYGICLRDHHRVFDCQLAEFILASQRTPFPSLDDCLTKYGLGSKLHTVLDEYWAKGVDTPQIPLETLTEYLSIDLEKTDELYTHVQQILPSSQRALLQLLMQDLRVLQEMEFNGIRIDWAQMEQAAHTLREELDGINREILLYCPEETRGWFNTGSNDHISALLYGGTLTTKLGVSYQHTYKTGPRAGETIPRSRWESVSHVFPRLVEPLPKTELKKPGFFSTGADILSQLTKPRKLLRLLLRQAEASKLLSTYFEGAKKIALKMDWTDGFLHGQYNQCIAVTGRLSSSNPNLQNQPPEMDEYIISRY